MLDNLREKLKGTGGRIACAVAVVILLGSAASIYLSLRPESPPAGSRYAETIYRKCTDASCGHVASDSRLDLVKKGYMPLEKVEEPLGDGRRCPRCGKMTLRFARRNARGEAVFTTAPVRED